MRTVRAVEEVEVAVVLGATRAQAVAVTRALVGEGLLEHGVAVIAGAVASRWGIDIPDALRAIADGREVGRAFSDYELRVGREEAESDLEDAWASRDPGDPAWSRLRGGAEFVAESDVTVDEALVEAAVPASVHHLSARDVAGTA